MTAIVALLLVALTIRCGSQIELLEVRPRITTIGDLPSRDPPCEQREPVDRDSFFRWSGDGSFIVLIRGDRLYRTAPDGSGVWLIDTEPIAGGHTFDLAPDGRQIVYSGCQVNGNWVDYGYGRMRDSHKYELVRANIDGSRTEVLAQDTRRIVPAWSPDGARIAFHSHGSGLTVMTASGSERREIEIPGLGLDVSPQWSPDSQRLAVTAVREGEPGGTVDFFRDVYTVGMDGARPRRLVHGVVSAPAWSPDGRWLAYARIHRDDVILAAIRADGTDERLVTPIRDWDQTVRTWNRDSPRNTWIPTLLWSPAGTHLLYSCGRHLCVVTTDGRPMGQTPALPEGNIGAWSPDGSRIAVAVSGRGPFDEVLYTVAPDGGRYCPLVISRYHALRYAISLLGPLNFGLDKEYPLAAVRDCDAAA